MQSHNAEDENQRENQYHHGVDFQSRAFVGVESWIFTLAHIPLQLLPLNPLHTTTQPPTGKITRRPAPT